MKTFQIFIATSFIVLQSISHTVVAETELPQTTVAQKEVSRELKFTGTVEAVNQGTASSQTSGRVIATLVDVGDLVAKDDVILQLRDNQQRANLQTAEAGVRAAQAQFDSAQKENLRIQEIRKKELVSQSVADNALASRDAAKANLDAAKGRLKDSEEQLEFTRIRAPYSGIVLERHVEVGETVNPGTPLYTGMSLEFLRVLADVPQKDIDAIREYKQARIELKDSAVTIQGDALTFFGYADPQTSTFKVRAALPAGTAGLYPGMYVAIYFQVGKSDALVVPSSAVVKRDEVTAIYVKQADNIQFRQIKTGREFNFADQPPMLEVLSGLRVDESIILEPSAAIAWLNSQPKSSEE